MKCQQTFCNHQATSEIHLEFRVNASHPPAVSSTLVYLCNAHALAATWDDLVSEADFDAIGNRFEEVGRRRPVKQYCNIVITPISNEPENNNSSLS